MFNVFNPAALRDNLRESALELAVLADRAKILVMDGNFHGRTTTIVGFSSDEVARRDFGPFTPGFQTVPYADSVALAEAVDEETIAVLLEPIQGEAGVLIPRDGYLRAVREICDDRGILMIADEIQSGLARTGRSFACDHESVVPDIYVLGKALGGGLYPVSAVAADAEVMAPITAGSHGSTFGGNPLAAAIGREVIAMLSTGEFQARAAELGARLGRGLEALIGHGVVAVRARGLWAGVDVDPELMTGRAVSEAMMARGVLVKDTHESTLRFAPPLVASEDDIDLMVSALADTLR